ncbi:MAG: GNAT family N-acetyltransferase [Pseudomonadota bacterium]
MERMAEATCKPGVGESGAPHQAEHAGGVTISCYENNIPAFVDAELERLYGSIFSSLVHFRIYGGPLKDIHTYVVRRGMVILTLLIFRREKSRVQVINEVIWLDEAEIRQFASYVFATYRTTHVISFKAIRTQIHDLAFPCQMFNALEDIVLTLPGSAQEYLASLGKNTRRNIRRYMEKTKRAFPQFSFQVFEKGDVSEQQIRDIIDLNRARMADKNKSSLIDEEETRRIISLTRQCGLVGVAMIDGRVCAGALSYRVGSNYFLSILAHDPACDEFWMGILCCYLTVCECIARGGKEFHFLWGRYEYKFTLLAVQRDLSNLAVYRSLARQVMHGDLVLKMALGGYRRQASLRLHDAMRRDNALARLALGALHFGRRLRRPHRGQTTDA